MKTEQNIDIQNLSVDEFSSPCIITVEKDANLEIIVNLMKKEGIRHLPVMEGNRAVGIISDRDIKIVQALNGADSLTASNIMTAYPFTVLTGTPLHEVAYVMSKNKYGSALIEDDEGKIFAIFTSTDALNALIEVLRGDVLD